MNPFAYLCSELTDGPILMRPDTAERMVRALWMKGSGAAPQRLDADVMTLVEMQQSAQDDGDPVRRNGYEVIDGVAVIGVHGPLLHRRNWLWEMFGFTSYESVTQKVMSAHGDDLVRTILLDVDSPGGLVSGCFDAGRKIRSLEGKPIIGAANESAYSAAYALISACDEIYAPETAGAGSIGVYTLHSDFTRALDREGIELTMVRAGERKARGGAYERADKKTMAKKQAGVDNTWEKFVQLVADHRGLETDAVFALEGDWFDSEDSMTHGLIDGIGSFESIFNRARSLAN